MDSGDGSVSKRRTRQQSLKCMVEIIEKRNELSQSGNSTNGRKRKKMETSGGDERNEENNRRMKFTRGTSEYFTNQTFIEEVSTDDDSSEEETDHDAVIVVEEEDSDPDIVIVAEEVETEPDVVNVTEEEEVETEPDVVNIAEEDEESEEETDPDVVIVEEEEEEEEEVESDPDVVNIAEEDEDEEESDPDVVIVTEEEEEEMETEPVIVNVAKDEDESDPNVVIIEEKAAPILNATNEVVSSKSNMCRTRDKSKEFTHTTFYSKPEFESSTDALRKNPNKILEESEFLKFIVDSIKNVDDRNEVIPPEEKEHVSVKKILPLVFRFEDEEPLPLEKEEWEKEIEDLFSEMNMCLLESHIGFTNPSVSPMQSGQLSECQIGNHKLKLDEQIGLICSVCSYVHLEMKYIFKVYKFGSVKHLSLKYKIHSSSRKTIEKTTEEYVC